MNTALEKLDLSDTDLKTESLIALSTVLRNNTTLRFLHINRPLLFTHQEEPTVHFAKMLKVCELLVLVLNCNDFDLGVWFSTGVESLSIHRIYFQIYVHAHLSLSVHPSLVKQPDVVSNELYSIRWFVFTLNR